MLNADTTNRRVALKIWCPSCKPLQEDGRPRDALEQMFLRRLLIQYPDVFSYRHDLSGFVCRLSDSERVFLGLN